jgi:hypothetical protein
MCPSHTSPYCTASSIRQLFLPCFQGAHGFPSGLCVQHLGHMTMFMVLLHAIEAAARPQLPGDMISPPVRPAAAAAEVFLGAVKHMHSSLQSRLAYIAAYADSGRAAGEQMATEYFATLAQSRELLSRSQELASVNFSPQIAAAFQQQVSALGDGLMLNFGVSDRAVHLAHLLPTAIATVNPAIGRLLSAMLFRSLPGPERERLDLHLPTVRVMDESSANECTVSFLCEGGTMTADIPFQMLKPMGRIAATVRLFFKWRAMNQLAMDGRWTSATTPGSDEDALSGAPLHIKISALSEVLDFARLEGMQSVVCDCSEQRRKFKQYWFEQVAAGTASARRSIFHCAQVLGHEEIVHGLSALQ